MARNGGYYWVIGAVLLLGGCQSGPKPTSEAVRAACVSQHYLKVNGYLDQPPLHQLDVTLTTADIHAYESAEGTLDYQRLVKDRSRRFSGKLLGVKAVSETADYTVVYGPVNKALRCIGVSNALTFAFFMEKPCKRTAPLIRLRERSLACGP